MKKTRLLFCLLFWAKMLFGQTESTLKIEQKEEPSVMFVEVLPQFPGGEVELLRFFARNIIYPEKAKLNKTQGRVILRFSIEKSGRVVDPKIMRGIGDCCDEEALRVALLMPAWKRSDSGDSYWPPSGKIEMNIPVIFKLD